MKTIVIKLLLISFLISCTEENADVNQLIFNDFQTSLQEEMEHPSRRASHACGLEVLQGLRLQQAKFSCLKSLTEVE